VEASEISNLNRSADLLISELKSLRVDLELRDKTTQEALRYISDRLGLELEIRERLAVLEDRIPQR
jgi:hypothetical protein